ncbi:MAG: hypothetical protein H7Z16_17925 [Pyrinomonadaceae bacterium]|nr:hypothetical protein [Pyrinomonadaceae bacterium]
MNNKLKPALLGGLLVGLPSALLSIIPIANWCCCIWSIAGGVLAGFLYIKSSQTQVSVGEGAIVGGMAGAVGGIIYLIIALPIALVFGMAMMSEQLTRSGVDIPVSPFLLMILGGIITAIFLAVLATLGGLLAVPIFEKRKGNGVPPPPQDFGGTPGAYGTAQ